MKGEKPRFMALFGTIFFTFRAIILQPKRYRKSKTNLFICDYAATLPPSLKESCKNLWRSVGEFEWGVCKFSDFRAITRYNYGPLRSVRLISSKYPTPFENARDRATIRLGIASLIANILVVLLFACRYFFRYTIIQPTALQHGSYMCNQVLDTVT